MGQRISAADDVEPIDPPGGQCHPSPGGGRRAGEALAQTRGGAGDQHDPIVEPELL